MMFSNKEKEQMLESFEKRINKTYKKKTGINGKQINPIKLFLKNVFILPEISVFFAGLMFVP